MSKTFQIQLLRDTAIAPTRANRGPQGDVGYDLHLDLGAVDRSITLGPLERRLANTGVALAPPAGSFVFLADRSGLASKNGLTLLGRIVDPAYTGEIKAVLYNTSDSGGIELRHGDRIAQIIFLNYSTPEPYIVDELEKTNRGDGGFGSTGR